MAIAMEDPNNGKLLIRLDERTKAIQKELADVKMILEKQYVTKEEIKPIKTVFYGMLGLVLTAVGAAILKLVVTSGSG